MQHKGVNLMINVDIRILKLTDIHVGSMTTYRLLLRWCICVFCRGAQDSWGKVRCEGYNVKGGKCSKTYHKIRYLKKIIARHLIRSIKHNCPSNGNRNVMESQHRLCQSRP